MKFKTLSNSWQQKHAELMLNYEQMRGMKGEIKSELERLRAIDIKARMDNEDDIRNTETKILTEEE